LDKIFACGIVTLSSGTTYSVGRPLSESIIRKENGEGFGKRSRRLETLGVGPGKELPLGRELEPSGKMKSSSQ
jgi:hypothetical protein